MLVDISPPLSPATAVFPGDTALSRKILMDTGKGDHLTLSTLTSTVHIGSHADAESHYKPGGKSIDQHPIGLYLGPCVVAPVRCERGRRFGLDTIDEKWLDAIDGLTTNGQPGRLLLQTGTGGSPGAFPNDLAAPEPELIDALVAREVRLLGVDTPSVDLADAKDLVGHAACARGGVSILEGLVLDGVEPGIWELIALPLRLVGFDASPVRAVLRR